MNKVKSISLTFFALITLLFFFQIEAQLFDEKLQSLSWTELQEFQKDNLFSAATLNLSNHCPKTLKNLQDLYSKYYTGYKNILGYDYYWTNYYDKNFKICLVKHNRLTTLSEKNPNPNQYQLLSTLEARILLSAADSLGFKNKGVNNDEIREYNAKKSLDENQKYKEKLRIYGGDRAVYTFIKRHKPFTEVQDFQFQVDNKKKELSKNYYYYVSANRQLFDYFEQNYTKQQRQVLIDKVNNRHYSTDDLILLNNYWSLTALQTKSSKKTKLLDKSSYRIYFDKVTQSVYGNMNCNTYSGKFELEKGMLSLKSFLTTRVSCIYYLDKRERVYSKQAKRMIDKITIDPRNRLYSEQTKLISSIYQNAVDYKIQNEELILLTADSNKLFFKKIINPKVLKSL